MSNWTFLKPSSDIAGSISPQPATPLGETLTPPSNTQVVTDLKNWGFRSAGQSNASPQVLKTILGWIYHNKVSIDDAQAKEEQERIADIDQQLAALQGDLRTLTHDREQTKEQIAIEHESIAQKRRDIGAVQAGDGSLVEAQGLGDRASLWIAGFILAVLTVYLFLFYVSAIYNAFIFDPASAAEEGLRTGHELSVTIFNGAAFQKAWASGGMTFVFISTAPSIVIGLGFLIHHFSRQQKRLYIAAIILVTFFFDLLLAYQIVYQIDRIKVLTGESTRAWDIGVLVHSPEFYIILLAGFVVYIIWGLILQVVLEGVEKLHPARALSRTLRASIQTHEASVEHLNNELRNIGRRESEVSGQIAALEQRRSPKETKNRQFFRHIEEVMHGWLQYIAIAFPDECERKQAEAIQVREETVRLLTT